MKQAEEGPLYVKGIDGLRAVAVLAVMLFHLDPSFLPGGFSGVDVFFVISGYVVSASLARYGTSGFSDFAASFYARRMLRIFPALIVCLLVSAVASTLLVPASWLSHASSRTGTAAFLGLANFALVLFDDGYFSPRTDFNLFAHAWSLAVEEQFYLLFPPLFYLWLRSGNRQGLAGRLARGLLPGLLLLSAWHSLRQTSANPESAFYLLPSRFWELAAGALLFQLHSRQRLLSSAKAGARLLLAAGVLLTLAGFVLADRRSFPLPWALLPVLGGGALICGLRSRTEDAFVVRGILEQRLVVHVGKISYSLYLWHWPVYVLLRWTIGLESSAERALAVAAAVVLASISHHFVERPFRRGPLAAGRSSREVVRAGLAAIAASCLVAALILAVQPFASLSVTRDREVWYPHPWPKRMAQKGGRKIFAGRRIFAIGDSHAGAYATMLQKTADEYGVEIRNISAGGCGIANLLKPKTTEGKKCARVFERQLDEIRRTASKGDVVFFASLRMNRLCDQWTIFLREGVIAAQASEKALANYRQAREEAAAIVGKLGAMGLNVLIDAPKPVFASPPFRCSDWFNRSNPVCAAGFAMDRDFLLRHRQPVMESLKALSGQFRNLTVWDPFPTLCPGSVCSAFSADGRPLFFDGDHLSAHGNRVLWPSFAETVRKIWQP